MRSSTRRPYDPGPFRFSSTTTFQFCLLRSLRSCSPGQVYAATCECSSSLGGGVSVKREGALAGLGEVMTRLELRDRAESPVPQTHQLVTNFRRSAFSASAFTVSMP